MFMSKLPLKKTNKTIFAFLVDKSYTNSESMTEFPEYAISLRLDTTWLFCGGEYSVFKKINSF